MIDVHFQPGGGALEAILREIGACRRQLRCSAYGFTHPDIAAAVIKANGRGVDCALVVDARASGGLKVPSMQAIADKIGTEPLLDIADALGNEWCEMANKQQSVLQALVADGVPVWLDAAHAIQHQKVLVFDASTVAFGSMNFTDNGVLHNSENFAIVRSADLAKKFLTNWELHKGHSSLMPKI